MARFGSYAVIDEVTHHFEKEPRLVVENQEPRPAGDELAIAKFLVQGRSEMGLDGVRRDYPPTNAEVMHREIAHLFAGTNIPVSETTVEDGGDPSSRRRDRSSRSKPSCARCPTRWSSSCGTPWPKPCPGWGPLRQKKVNSTPSSES